MNPSTLFFYFAEDQICFAVESRSSGYTKDKGKKLYHLNFDDESVRKLLRYVKYKFWTEKISEKNTPKIIAVGDTNTPNSFFFRLEFEGYLVDFTPDKFTEQQEKSEMKVVTAEDISRIFTELEEKYGKDKAIGILVGTTQESVRLIDGKSAAQILFEKLQEHQNKEENKMEFKHKGYVLNLEITEDGKWLITNCVDIGFGGRYIFGHTNYFKATERFKNEVDRYLANKQSKEEKDMTIDKDVELAQQFIEVMEKVEKEMEPLVDDPNSGYILTLKLKRIYDFYKDSVLCLSSFESFRNNVVYKIRKKVEEEKKKEVNSVTISFNNALESLKKSSKVPSTTEILEKLSEIHSLYGVVLNISLDEVKKKFFEMYSK